MDLKDVHPFISHLRLWKSKQRSRHMPNISNGKPNTSVTHCSSAVVKLQNGGPRYRGIKGSLIPDTYVTYYVSIKLQFITVNSAGYKMLVSKTLPLEAYTNWQCSSAITSQDTIRKRILFFGGDQPVLKCKCMKIYAYYVTLTALSYTLLLTV